MVALERSVIPGLANKLNNWRRYVDDTICYIKVDSIYYVLSKLNDFHKSIQFTIEVEKKGRISFLDVLMTRDKTTLKQQYTASPLKITSTSIGHHMCQINGKWAPFEH